VIRHSAIIFGLAVSLWSLVPGRASASPIQFTVTDGGNGDYYDLVLPTSSADSFSWTAANAAANASTFMGVQGHLTVVTSAAINNFLQVNFASQLFDNGNAPAANGVGPTNSTYAWIGLYAPTETSAFQWVNGAPVSYTNWAPGEPNFQGTPLWQYVHYWTRDFGSGPTFTWNNDQNDGFQVTQNNNIYGYFVEYDGPFQTPEPSTITLLASGFLTAGALHFVRRRRGRAESSPGR